MKAVLRVRRGRFFQCRSGLIGCILGRITRGLHGSAGRFDRGGGALRSPFGDLLGSVCRRLCRSAGRIRRPFSGFRSLGLGLGWRLVARIPRWRQGSAR